MRLLFLIAIAFALLSSMPARADVVVKDTLDPENFLNINAGGGYIAQNPGDGHQLDGRTFLGYFPSQTARLHELTFNFFARSQGSGQPVNNPSRSGMFDLSVAQYSSLSEAALDQLRVDGFFSESTQPFNVFSNPVGETIAADGLGVAFVYRVTYDLASLNLSTTPGQVNYLGISTSGVPIGLDFQPQRSDDSGMVLGSEPDYLRGFPLPSGLTPMSDYYPDAIQNSVRITITNFGDVRDADFNQDQIISGADFLEWQRNFGATSGPGLLADGNVDGVVDGGDFSIWAQYYGQTVPTSAVASLTVPEPTAAMVACMAILSIVSVCRWRNSKEQLTGSRSNG